MHAINVSAPAAMAKPAPPYPSRLYLNGVIEAKIRTNDQNCRNLMYLRPSDRSLKVEVSMPRHQCKVAKKPPHAEECSGDDSAFRIDGSK